MNQQPHILVVDDDPEIRQLLHEYLERNGFRATAVADGRGLWRTLESTMVDLIVLDLMLPGEDGLLLCRNLRARKEGPVDHSRTPVIMLTARGDETDRIVGLEMGADDYLAKPFNPRELLARIKAVLRRVHELPPTEETNEIRLLKFAGWTLDLIARHLLSPAGVIVSLSGSEFCLLRILLSRPNRIFSRDQLLELCQRREAGPFDRSIDVQISRLRRHLGDDARDPAIIKTIRGEGYVLSAEVSECR